MAPLTIVLTFEAATPTPRGRLERGGGAARPFEGRLALLSALDGELRVPAPSTVEEDR